MLELDLGWEGLDQAMKDLEAEVADVVRGLSVYAWDLILAQTPQFHGRMVASYTYSFDSPEFVDRSATMPHDPAGLPGEYFKTDADLGDVFQGRRKGDPEAIGIANFANAGRDRAFQLGQTIYIANGVDHGEGGYASDIEAGERLRPVNQPGHMVQRALDGIQSLWGNDITEQRAQILRSLHLGS